MKKLVFFFSLVITTIVLTAAKESEPATMNFFEGSWQDALQKAKKENKLIFLDVYAEWCGPCKRLKSHTFKDKNVIEFYNKNFINVTLDGEKGEGITIANKLGVTAYPTLVFMDKSGKTVLYTLGFQRPKELIEAGKEALKRAK